MAATHAHFKKIAYDKLNARQREQFNFQKIAATLADYGFNCIKLSDDWQGADFLAYHVDGTTTLRVQLKSRVAIMQKYCGKNIWMAFPHDEVWYLIEHDRLVEKVGANTTWLTSSAWLDGHEYKSKSINPELLASLADYKLGPVYGVVLDEDFRP